MREAIPTSSPFGIGKKITLQSVVSKKILHLTLQKANLPFKKDKLLCVTGHEERQVNAMRVSPVHSFLRCETNCMCRNNVMCLRQWEDTV